MTREQRLRRRDLGPLAAAALAALLLPSRALAQDAGGKDAPAGGAPKEPSEKAHSTVDLALAWLARHQDADGRWSTGGFASRCAGTACGGAGSATADVRTSGLVLTAFLGAGQSHQSGEHKDVVKEGLRYLRNVQSENGEFGPRASPLWFASHVAATDAMVEAYGMTQSKIFDDCARRALRFLESMIGHRSGFRPDAADLRHDAATLSDAALVLRSARLAEFPIEREALDAIAAWFAERTDARTGAVRADDPKAKPDPLDDDDRAVRGALVRIWAPLDAEPLRRDPTVPRLADRLVAKPPGWTPSPKGRMRFGAWMRRTQFLQQAHGEKHLAWCRALEKVLAANQRTDGCARGSWDPLDVDGAERGRVESTALCTLAMMWPYQWAWRLRPPEKDPLAAPDPGGPATPGGK